MGYRLGIDLGTTYTAAALARDGRAEMATLGDRGAAIPSVLFLRPDGEYLIGEAALRRGLTEPDRMAREFKRRLGDPAPLLLGGSPVPADALMGVLLQWVVDHVTTREAARPDAVIVTHPANWGPYKRELLEQAITRSGVRDIASMLTEPEAAATSYASTERLQTGAVVAVYDLGGGTFDAAVLRKRDVGFDLLGTPEGLERTGGIDFDEAVFGHVAAVLGDTLQEIDVDDPRSLTALARLRDDCVTAKEALSSDTDVAIPVLLPTVQTEVRLTRGEFEAMIRPTLTDTVSALTRALRSADVAPADLHAVLLVGGSSRIPLVGELVSREIGRPVAVDVHPKHAVALGAALAGTVTAAEFVAAEEPPPAPPPSPSPVVAPSPPPSVAAGDGGGGRSRRPIIAAAAAVIAVILVAVVVLLTRNHKSSSSSSGSSDTTETSETLPGNVPVALSQVTDGTPNEFKLATFAVPGTPEDVVDGAGSAWVLSGDGNKVIRIDPNTNQTTAIIRVGSTPRAIAFGATSVWTSDSGDNTVSRIDPGTNTRTEKIDVGGTPTGIAASDTMVWVALQDGSVVRIDPGTNLTTGDPIKIGGSGGDVVIGGGAVWVSSSALPGVIRIDEATGHVDNVVHTGASPGRVTFGAGALWVEDESDNTVTKVDPARSVVVTTTQVNEDIADLVVDGTNIWASLHGTNNVARIETATGRLVGKVPVGQAPSGLTQGHGSVWVCDTDEQKVTRIAHA